MTVIDSRDLGIINGFHITAHTEPDDFMTYDDIPEVYDDEDRAAFLRGEWDYVTLVVTASRAGVDLGDASLGGTDNGRIAGKWSDPLRDSRIEAYGLVEEAIAAAEEKRAELCYAAVEKLADAMKGQPL